MIALGLDLSLTNTGVGVVRAGGIDSYSYGRKGKRDEPLMQRLDRLNSMTASIETVITTAESVPRVALIENPATGTPGGSAHDRSGLWWFVVQMLTSHGIPTISVTTQKLKIYATGQGTKLQKEDVLLAMVRRHPEAPISNNDEADAVTLALMGARLVGRAYETKQPPQTHLRALEGLELP